MRGVPIIDPATAAVALDGPLTVAAGRTAHHRLAVTNLAPHPLVLQTNGRITAPVLDPESGRLVGIATEAQTLPEISFEAAPGTTVKVPLLVGTASVDPGSASPFPPATGRPAQAVHRRGAVPDTPTPDDGRAGPRHRCGRAIP